MLLSPASLFLEHGLSHQDNGKKHRNKNKKTLEIIQENWSLFISMIYSEWFRGKKIKIVSVLMVCSLQKIQKGEQEDGAE